ncbi:carbamoyltransferase HypF [Hyphomicrobium sp. 802]|uniref:carbamoyltransferase HypF n=1 Tax=Hyphomicrobium sp. 802 TaxID=1112272 RepID=UPI00045E80C8|nr:carbamoyltransferase HypF [Hyphomicrobium sp. 802]
MKSAACIANKTSDSSVEIRVRGRVQGVGFRPFVWRNAHQLGLWGYVLNDAEGVLIRVRGDLQAIDALVREIRTNAPELASVASIDLTTFAGDIPETFEIKESTVGVGNTEISPDTALCPDCAGEITQPLSRRYRYPFTTCTNCGPRLSIVQSIPYDRATTSMAAFDLCPECAAEYTDPRDRRFHAETTACPACGPQARLIRLDGKPLDFDRTLMRDDIDATRDLLSRGEIVAIKGLGGYQLACDATRTDAVQRLRDRKNRDRKPFALMARDLDVIRQHATVSADDETALTSAAAPIVLLDANGPERLPEAIAPGLRTLGFMLPTTPLHALLLQNVDRPVVMTSGNRSDSPQVISDEDAKSNLADITPYALVHNRNVLNRVDDSVVRIAASKARIIRRSRGYAPAAMRLPQGFEAAPPLIALGGDLKSTFCVLKCSSAVLSQHIGDLDDIQTSNDFARTIDLYCRMLDAQPEVIVCDRHISYRSRTHAESLARKQVAPLIEIQHHHAHIASCLAENGRELHGAPVLGIALDGLGFGDDGEIWGGEFLLADYARSLRLATFKPVAMPGGDVASREPWRNLYAHLTSEMGWPEYAKRFSDLDVFRRLDAKPRQIVDAMLQADINVPKASSCGRLFDAVAAALGLCFDRQGYEGEAAAQLEAAVDDNALLHEDDALSYPFTIVNFGSTRLPYIEPLAAWQAILEDLMQKTPIGVMAARFHKGLARGIVDMTASLAIRKDETEPRFDTVALSGGCFNNRILLEQVLGRLQAKGFKVLTHADVPAGDGGLSLGQAVIAAAQLITAAKNKTNEGSTSCVSVFQAAS